MKILIVNTLYAPNKIGGAEISVQTLAEKFTVLGHKVVVVCLAKEASNYTINKVEIKALKIRNTYWPFEDHDKKSYQKLIWHCKDANNHSYDKIFTEIIKDFNPEILFTNNLTGFSTNVWCIAKKMDIKIIHTLRDYYLQCPKSTKFKNSANCTTLCLDCKVLSSPKKENSHTIDYVVGISEFVLKDHLNNGYFKGVSNKVVYNGFNLKTQTKKRPEKTFVFGFMGQINKSKGIELLVNSFSKFSSFDWELHIAGNINSKYLELLKSLNNSPKIIFVGYVDSSQFFEKIDLLIVPSLWNEPFGRVVLESIINRTPVLAANVGGISELLSNNRDFLFDTNLDSLTQKIEEVLQNPDVIKDFIFDEKFIHKFSIEKTVKDYLDIFNTVLNNLP